MGDADLLPAVNIPIQKSVSTAYRKENARTLNAITSTLKAGSSMSLFSSIFNIFRHFYSSRRVSILIGRHEQPIA